MKVKNRKRFHKLLDIVLDKEPESGVEINVASLNSTAEVWFFEVQDNGKIKTEKHYDRYGDGWRKWENGHTEFVTDEDVLEAMRNA